MQRQSCCSAKFLPILHLTFSGREPLPWPQAMKISRAPKPTSRCVFQLLPGCGKHTQLTAAFMLAGLGASLTKDQHPPRDRDISAASAHTPGTHHHHHSLQMPALILNSSVLLFLHESSVEMPDHTNLLSENRIHATEPLLLSVFTSIDALKIS